MRLVLEDLPAGDVGDVIGRETLPALHGKRQAVGEDKELETDDLFRHPHEVGILLLQAADTCKVAVIDAAVGVDQRALGGQLDGGGAQSQAREQFHHQAIIETVPLWRGERRAAPRVDYQDVGSDGVTGQQPEHEQEKRNLASPGRPASHCHSRKNEYPSSIVADSGIRHRRLRQTRPWAVKQKSRCSLQARSGNDHPRDTRASITPAQGKVESVVRRAVA